MIFFLIKKKRRNNPFHILETKRLIYVVRCLCTFLSHKKLFNLYLCLLKEQNTQQQMKMATECFILLLILH